MATKENNSKIVKRVRQSEESVEYYVSSQHYKNKSLWCRKGGMSYPVVIFTKPQGCSQEEYDELMAKIKIYLPQT
jgi:hypothetical protein